jgi:MoaA/NifB/PqqE/SkfB family radical SAM enzyme
MCDIWKANSEKRELSVEDLGRHVRSFRKLGVKEIVFSGGEALMHSNLWNFCTLLRKEKIELTLLSTGLLLEKHAVKIIENFKEVIVSIDGSERVHDQIRNVPGGFAKIREGLRMLKGINPFYRITARCVVQRYNYTDFENIVHSAKDLLLDQISFLAADVTTTAFNRNDPWSNERLSEIALTLEEARDFDKKLDVSFVNLKSTYDSGFIAESPKKIKNIAQYYLAINGASDFQKPVCNAPWVSAVIESNGDVMPCFFHKPYGNIFNAEFSEIINSAEAIAFRKELVMSEDPICKKCVCSLKLGVTALN